MTTSLRPRFAFDNSFVRELEGLYVPWTPAAVPAPRLLACNDELAEELGLDPATLRSDEGVAMLAGNVVPDGAAPVAQAYAGHQFGGYNPRLGDGRALLLGEVLDVHGRRRDLHLKGSGRTPFSRGGDGKAAVGPMLRELVIGEAMHGLGIPTTRALAVVATGETVVREQALPGALLVRVASSHLRVGSFQYASAQPDPTLLRRVADHAIARHHPQAADAANPYLALYEAVLEAQARLVARWLHVGFVHGVMNTDNMTISGETIDYGPCAFLDAFDPATVFSSIDHQGRYAFGNQPSIAQWNLARLAEAMLALFADDEATSVELATEVLRTFPQRHDHWWHAGMCDKLGLRGADPDDVGLIDDLLALLHATRADFTASFRALSAVLRGEAAPFLAQVADHEAATAWLARWQARVGRSGADAHDVARSMDTVNPRFLARNHLVEEALAAAVAGDLTPLDELVDVLRDPFTERPDRAHLAEPPAPGGAPYRTFCGT